MQVFSDNHQRQREEVDPDDQLILGGDPGNHLDARHLIEDHDLGEPPSCQSAVVRFRNAEVVVLPSYFNLKCDKP